MENIIRSIAESHEKNEPAEADNHGATLAITDLKREYVSPDVES